MQQFWNEVCDDDLIWNWHLDKICDELCKIAFRVAAGLPKEYDLIINVPPGTTKTKTACVMFQPWCWVRWPWMRFITASYSGALSLEAAESSRDLVKSEKFKYFFPELGVKRDKDQKSNFRLVERTFDDNGVITNEIPRGNRFSTSVGGTLTGFHGHILLVDDPLDPNRASSEGELKRSNHWIDQTLSTRKVNKKVSTTILIMQRLHQDDPTGHWLDKKNKKLRHICLPGEIRTEQYREQLRPKSWDKFYENGLLDPNRMPMEVLEDMLIDLGQYGFAGQVGQTPIPPGGGMFKVDNFSIIDTLPYDPGSEKCRTVRYWDKAGTDRSKNKNAAYTCGVKMTKIGKGSHAKLVIEDVKRGQWATEKREHIIRSTAEADGHHVGIFHEQEPGSGGKDSAKATTTNLMGFTAKPDRPSGNKVYRADPYSVQVNNGNVILMRGSWNTEFVEEHRFFPNSKFKDQVDAASGAFSKLTAKKEVRTLVR